MCALRMCLSGLGESTLEVNQVYYVYTKDVFVRSGWESILEVYEVY